MKGHCALIVGRTVGAVLAVLSIVGCSSGGGAGSTFEPLGPTPSAVARESGLPSPSAGSPPASPPGSRGIVIEVVTFQDSPVEFTPNTLTAPANTTVTVTYTNDSKLPHNIRFFAGPDHTAPSLGATERVRGPNATRSVTFTTPAQPGSYYFLCNVHPAEMDGILQVP